MNILLYIYIISTDKEATEHKKCDRVLCFLMFSG